MTTVMNRRRFLEISAAAAAALPAHSTVKWASAGEPPEAPSGRGLLVYVDARLGSDGDGYRRSLEAALASHPLLAVLANARPPIDTRTPTQQQLAYNHVIVATLPDDPLLVQAWQREALIQAESRSIYAFGFGHLHGSIGYLEADRNPFLHAAAIPKAPYECEWVSLTGTDPIGVGLAVEAFLKQSLVNGLVAARGWKRTASTLLDRDPLTPGFAAPAVLPATLGSLRRIALTQVAEDEYRSVLSDAGAVPRSIWQGKYYEPGQWDVPGQIASFHHYTTGLHRRAYGNAVWAASFASHAEASTAAPHIAAAAKLMPSGDEAWAGDLPPYAWGIADMGDGPTTGTLKLQLAGDTVLLTAQSLRIRA